ncbi:hypothetical protein RIR_jg40962.t1 [Rhizophagus irregularis DAOM 181602=DAOM 197198]|uniref:Uncharacterized protein n=1 Tax=Rhizophagus irregularis (strain DAOM 181602 / DAOM 197198 / MUCL 43194) TaxID=747089 RepID=U9SR57_RHIID|nr:hypothetical protein RIR_jg40962.t1 [Rhizophagus irregularis DAOM 181602=DAOM 197198]
MDIINEFKHNLEEQEQILGYLSEDLINKDWDKDLQKAFLNKVSIMLEDFELLLKLKWKSNAEFYLKKSQTEEEALKELE